MHLHNDHSVLTEVLEAFGCKRTEEVKAGNILVFKVGRVDSHLGILTDETHMVHALGRPYNKVVYQSIGEAWMKRMTKIYKFPGVR